MISVATEKIIEKITTHVVIHFLSHFYFAQQALFSSKHIANRRNHLS